MRVRSLVNLCVFAEFTTQANILTGKLAVYFISIGDFAAVGLSFDFFQRISEESFEVQDFAGFGFVERRTIFDADDSRNIDAFGFGCRNKTFQFFGA